MYYAKSEPIESIKDHTDKLLENLKILKNIYGDKIAKVIKMDENRFWELMEIACTYHDVGKVFTGFQNQIRKKIGEKLIPTKFTSDMIKHEQISPAFVPTKFYNLTKDERKLVCQSIYYHHERDIINVDRDLLKDVIEEDIKPNLENIKRELGIQVEELKTFYLTLVEGKETRITEESNLYNDYCLMKGLLHRLDYCSSAHVTVEDDTIEEIGKFVEEFIKNKGSDLNDLQKFSKEKHDKNLIVIGSTGMGKTEAALLWSSGDKTFFTLPLRISINAIYSRIYNQIGYKHVGLLHSTAFDYLEKMDEEDNYFMKIEQSKNLYQKLTTCTIDQIFPFVFKYRGYERVYATMSYSKIIIDEIQAYSPEIVAIVLKGLEMMNNLGGKFMIMTATLPRIYKEKLEEMGIKFEYNEFIKPIQRHKIELIDEKINSSVNEISEKATNKKVLVIVNTINKAIELYRELKELGTENVNLLHSRFIQEDRSEKEEKIKDFSNKGKNGVWITTQIVEASLDIDFDMLYTEMSTLDSLFQRLGRCYRSREYTSDECNVKIYTNDCSGIKCVYNEEIFKKSIELLSPHNRQILEEKIKIELVDKLYSKEVIGNTNFYKTFQEANNYLNNINDYDLSKNEATKVLRNIDNYNVIPKSVYDENLDLFKKYEVANENKFDLRGKLNKLFISISNGNWRKFKNRITDCPYIKENYIIDCKYDKNVGLLLESDEEYELETREF